MSPAPTAALFASSFFPHVGGVEELVRQLAKHHRDSARAAIVVTNRHPANLPAEDVHEQIFVRRYPFLVPRRHPRRWLEARLQRHGIVDAIVRDLDPQPPQVIHVQCVSGNAWYADQVARRLGVPLVLTLQGELTMDATNVYARSRFLRRTLRRLLDEADAVTACSSHTLREAERFADVRLGARGSVIHNGVALADFEVGPHQPGYRYVLGIGRLVAEKGFDVLLRAFALASRETGFDLRLLMAGDGPERDPLQRLAGELGITSMVTWLGAAPRAEVPALFAGAAVVAVPSRKEPFGIVNLEAMAAGAPLVASRVGGVPEVVHDDVNGLLVPPGDPAALACAVVRLAADRELAGRLSTAGRATARSHDWARIGADYDRLYEAVTGRGEPA